MEFNHWIDCHSEMSHLLQACGREKRKPSLCILEGDVLRGVTVRWRKMTLHLWWHCERGRADSYPNSFLCRSAAPNQSRSESVWWTGRTVTPASMAPRKETCQRRRHFTRKWCLTCLWESSALCMHACNCIFNTEHLTDFGFSVVAAAGAMLQFCLWFKYSQINIIFFTCFLSC